MENRFCRVSIVSRKKTKYFAGCSSWDVTLRSSDVRQTVKGSNDGEKKQLHFCAFFSVVNRKHIGRVSHTPTRSYAPGDIFNIVSTETFVFYFFFFYQQIWRAVVIDIDFVPNDLIKKKNNFGTREPYNTVEVLVL